MATTARFAMLCSQVCSRSLADRLAGWLTGSLARSRPNGARAARRGASYSNSNSSTDIDIDRDSSKNLPLTTSTAVASSQHALCCAISGAFSLLDQKSTFFGADDVASLTHSHNEANNNIGSVCLKVPLT